MLEILFNVFGSSDSTDFDVMIKVDEMPNVESCRILCEKYDKHFQNIITNKEVNSNLCVVKDGVVAEVYKGTADEVNNVLYYTYDLHEQQCPIFVKMPVKRDIIVKVNRSVRSILSHLTRTQYRPLIKQALRGPLSERIAALRAVDFSTIDDLSKNNSNILDYRKVVAFQVGQCLGLFARIELYTKSAIAGQYPTLEPFLYRKDISNTLLGCIVSDFLDAVENNIDNRDSIYEVMKK